MTTAHKIPETYLDMRREHPDVMSAYEALGEACKKGGPLDAKTVELIKLGVSLSAGLEGASHSHARRALSAGCTREELLHVVLLLTPTVGFPSMMRARSWVEDVLRAGAERED
jgi:4-carboxymuconolactone decarboxylase